MYEVNQKTLAAALGISSRQIRNLRDQGMFGFITGTKKYDLTKCVSTHEAADVEEFLNRMLLDFRGHLLSLPTKIAPTILNENDINVIIRKLETEMLDALDELAEYDPDRINKNTEPEDDEDEEEEELTIED